MRLYLIIVLVVLAFGCQCPSTSCQVKDVNSSKRIIPGAERISLYLNYLKGKNVALVVNQSSRVHDKHLLDTLLQSDINIVKIFSPEHGFRGNADAGAHIKDSRDTKTGLPIISLYGKNRKPTPAQLKDVNIVVFDIQDVGVRFYTYISTLHLVMEACAENHKPLLLLDRPNPNGHYIDGPILDTAFRSFVGMHPVPIVYGMTIGEYGKMINGEHWLNRGIQCELSVIPCLNYKHNMAYRLPVKPSPNLPNYRSILLYPSLCLLEPTTVSIGRGTSKQFQIMGNPSWPDTLFSFIPRPNKGASHPKQEGKDCYGYDFTKETTEDLFNEDRIHLNYLIKAWAMTPHSDFFISNGSFDRIAGSSKLRNQLIAGASEEDIRQSWEEGLRHFKAMRLKYLLYP